MFPFFPICCDTDFTNGVPSGWTAIDSATNQAIGLSTTVCGSFGSILGGHAARLRLDPERSRQQRRPLPCVPIGRAPSARARWRPFVRKTFTPRRLFHGNNVGFYIGR